MQSHLVGLPCDLVASQPLMLGWEALRLKLHLTQQAAACRAAGVCTHRRALPVPPGRTAMRPAGVKGARLSAGSQEALP